MDYITVFQMLFSKSQSGEFGKMVSVSKGWSPKHGIRFYIDLRSFYLGNETPTPMFTGINLTPDEFSKLLPLLEKGEDVLLETDARRVTAKPTTHPGVMQVFVEKLAGRKQDMTLGKLEVQKLIFNKQKILDSISNNA